MTINFVERQLFISATDLQAGQLISFGYNGTIRWGVVVTPVWKMNCDCYVFDSQEEVAEELLETVARDREMPAGTLYSSFGNTYTFKSFKLENMVGIRNYPFTSDIYKEDDDELSTGEPLVLDITSGTITVPDSYLSEGE